MMSKLVPSPDWFVGVDSLNLCENGHFVETIKIEVAEHSQMTSDVLWVFLTYLPTLIRYFTK